MRNILTVLGLLWFAGATAFAQIGIKLKPTKSDFISGEAINMDLTIANYMGTTIELKNRGNLPWLDVNIYRAEGEGLLMSQANRANFPALTLPPAREVSRRVDMRALYDLTRTGSYYATATVRSPDGRNLFSSGKQFFTIQAGVQLWKQLMATPDGSRREFILLSLASKGQETVYMQVCDGDTRMPINAVSMGPWLSVSKPICKVDNKLNVHVLVLCSPKYYAYGCINKDGRRVNFGHYLRLQGLQPSLVTTPDGGVKVDGAVFVDPKAPKASSKDASVVPM